MSGSKGVSHSLTQVDPSENLAIGHFHLFQTVQKCHNTIVSQAVFTDSVDRKVL